MHIPASACPQAPPTTRCTISPWGLSSSCGRIGRTSWLCILSARGSSGRQLRRPARTAARQPLRHWWAPASATTFSFLCSDSGFQCTLASCRSVPGTPKSPGQSLMVAAGASRFRNHAALCQPHVFWPCRALTSRPQAPAGLATLTPPADTRRPTPSSSSSRHTGLAGSTSLWTGAAVATAEPAQSTTATLQSRRRRRRRRRSRLSRTTLASVVPRRPGAHSRTTTATRAM